MTAILEQELALDDIGESYGRMRLVYPKTEQQMLLSLQRYGQMSPVVVCRGSSAGYELVDGFKRLRASRQIEGMDSLRARVIEMSARAAKAALLSLNWASSGVCDMEEAWVVRSLCRQDGLTQVEVGQLLDRDKSWVCRRLSLVERLADEVQSRIRLGLVSATVGRELARLPRGNQAKVLDAVDQHRLGSREAAGLVDLLNSASRQQHEKILNRPLDALGKHGLWRRTNRCQQSDARLSKAAKRILRDLADMERTCTKVATLVGARGLSELDRLDLPILAQPMGRARRAGRQAAQLLDDALAAADEETKHVSVQQPGGTGTSDSHSAQGGLVHPEAVPGSGSEPQHGQRHSQEGLPTAGARPRHSGQQAPCAAP